MGRRFARLALVALSAAQRGGAVAQLNLGDMYSRGNGVRRDPIEAYLWLGLAAARSSLLLRLEEVEDVAPRLLPVVLGHDQADEVPSIAAQEMEKIGVVTRRAEGRRSSRKLAICRNG